MSSIFNPTSGSNYVTQSQLDIALAKKISKSADGSLSFTGLTASGATTLSSTLAIPTIAGATSGVLHAAGTTGNVTNSLIVNADITTATVGDDKLASTVATAATADTIVKRGTAGSIASGPLTVNGPVRVDGTLGGGLNEFDLTQSLSDYYNHVIAGGSPYGGLNLETAGTAASNTYKMPGDGGTTAGYSALGSTVRGHYFYNKYNSSGGSLTGLTDADVQNSTTFTVKPLGVISTHNGTNGAVRNVLDNGSGGMTTGGITITSDGTSNIGNQLNINSATNSNIQFWCGIDNSSNGFIQSYQQLVGPKPLYLNSQGGAVHSQNNILDDGVGNITTAQIVYSVGSISQTGTTISGSSTVFTAAMIGGYITITNYATCKITARASNTSITVDISQTVPGGNGYTVYYGGTITANNLRIPTDGGSLNFNQTIKNKIVSLWDATPYDNTRHDFYGFGVASNILRYQGQNTSVDHVFYAATSATASNELARISGAGAMSVATTLAVGAAASTTRSATSLRDSNLSAAAAGWGPHIDFSERALPYWDLVTWMGNAGINAPTTDSIGLYSLPNGYYTFKTLGDGTMTGRNNTLDDPTGNMTVAGLITSTSTDYYGIRLPTAQGSSLSWGTAGDCDVGRSGGSNEYITSSAVGDLTIRSQTGDILFGKSTVVALKINNTTSAVTTANNILEDGSGNLSTTGTITVGKSLIQKVGTISGGTTQTLSNENYLWRFTGSSDMTCTLPSAASNAGLTLMIVNGKVANSVTINRSGSDFIDGILTSQLLANQHDRVTLVSDGISVWYST